MTRLDQRGQILIPVTLGFVLLAIFVGLAIDLGRAYLIHSRLQRVVDGAAIAAAFVLKGQADKEAEAREAARDAAKMNGFTCCEAGSDLVVNFVPRPVGGGPPIRFVQVTGSVQLPTTFMRLLSLAVGGSYDLLPVSAFAEAGPERPINLILVLDRSGSMGEKDPTGKRKIDALKCALTGSNCGGSGFLDLNFSAADQLAMTSFGKRGCGTRSGAEFTGDQCTPNISFGSGTAHIDALQSAIDALSLSGTTNTMEGLRTARTALASVIAERPGARHVVLLVTDGQPTALRRDNRQQCEQDPLTGAPLGGSPWADPRGCYFVKIGESKTRDESRGLDRFRLDNRRDRSFEGPRPYPAELYLNQMKAGRYAAREEAYLIRELAGRNVVIFAIGIGEPTNPDATARFDANARCLLGLITNDQNVIESTDRTREKGSCAAVYETNDGDPHNDLRERTPDVTRQGVRAPAAFEPLHQRGKVFEVDFNGDVQAQLQKIFGEIAALLKLRLTV